MLNNTCVSNSNNNYNYSVNAVSGTIRKSHPKSKITIEPLSERNRIWDDVAPVKCMKQGAGSIWDNDYKAVCVLQSMLVGDGRALVEWVLVEDFIEGDTL